MEIKFFSATIFWGSSKLACGHDMKQQFYIHEHKPRSDFKTFSQAEYYAFERVNKCDVMAEGGVNVQAPWLRLDPR